MPSELTPQATRILDRAQVLIAAAGYNGFSYADVSADVGITKASWNSQGAQWAMVLSGAQSAVAGGLFVAQSLTAAPPSIANVAGYAGVGAICFLISAVWLTVKPMRRDQRRPAR